MDNIFIFSYYNIIKIQIQHIIFYKNTKILLNTYSLSSIIKRLFQKQFFFDDFNFFLAKNNMLCYNQIMKKYLNHRIANIITVSEIFVLEYRKMSGKFSNDIDKHNFWEITYVEKGELNCTINNINLTLQQGDILFVEPNTQHFYQQNSIESKILCIGFECISSFLTPLNLQVIKATDKQISIIQNIVEEGNLAFTLNSNEQLVKNDNPPLGSMQLIILLLEQLILLSLRNFFNNENTGNLPQKQFYYSIAEKIKLYCYVHVKEKISISDICRDFSYSSSFICRIFKKQTGYSLINFFTKVKIEEAKKMLLHTNMTATEISDALMFSDPKYFNTCFKKIVGLTPNKFRTQNR